MPGDWLVWVIVLLSFADVVTTDEALEIGAREVGPVKWLFKVMAPITAILFVKFGFLSLIIWLHSTAQLALWTYWVLIIGYVVLVGNNLRQIKKQQENNERTP